MFKNIFGGADSTYLRLRKMALEQAAAADALEPGGVFGLVMDVGMERGSYTLTGFLSGDASLYFSSGGGSIGGIGHLPIRNAAIHLVKTAAVLAAHFRTAGEHDGLPAPGQVTFWMCTSTGLLRASDSATDLEERDRPLSSLFHAAQDLITLFRVLNEKHESLATGATRQESLSDEYLQKWLELRVGVQFGDAGAVLAALSGGADPNATDESGNWPMAALAIAKRNVEVLRVLLKGGGNPDIEVNHPQKGRLPLLFVALSQEDPAHVEVLLNAGASLHIRDADGSTPLMLAAMRGRTAEAKMLLQRGAQVDAPDNAGYTPLMMASNAGQLEAVELLLAHGAAVNATDNDLSTPIMFAAQYGYDAIVQTLLAAGADAAMRGTHGLSALDFADRKGHASTAAILRRTLHKKS